MGSMINILRSRFKAMMNMEYVNGRCIEVRQDLLNTVSEYWQMDLL